VKELRTPLYRIQLFQRERRKLWPWLHKAPQLIKMAQPTPLPPEVEAHVMWQGGIVEVQDIARAGSDHLPILMYHRVAPSGASELARYRVTPAAFEAQLRYLRDVGFHSIGLEDWQKAIETRTRLPGQPIILSFDDGYLDFLTYAWPLLKHYGFSATVFLVAKQVGLSNSWDQLYGEEVPLLGWEAIGRLREEGVHFGSHSASHRPLTALSLQEVAEEGIQARAILERGLGEPVTTFAYPYGDADSSVQYLMGACGYNLAVTCESRLSLLSDSPLALPRIEVSGSDGLPEFIAKLG
jgi:peptidoglycan/xylan/chitin deacetylase (PgdA/CDA1 family)